MNVNDSFMNKWVRVFCISSSLVTSEGLNHASKDNGVRTHE